MIYKTFRKLIPIAFLAIAFSSSCRKEDSVVTDGGAQVNFSTATVYFDTVFTSVGSTTKRFKIYNPNSKKIILSRVSLLHGNSSLFRLNVDGTPGKSVSNIEIGPKDSLFVFVEVTINPSTGATPFVVSDSIMFNWNGNIHAVGLVAWGQNAHYIRADGYTKEGYPIKIIAHAGQTIVWPKDTPIVIYGYAVVDSAAKLIIPSGARVYFHPGSGLWVYRFGTLKVNENGTSKDSVVFQGDRLDYAYRNLPGQWDEIRINEGSVGNVINRAIIKNGYRGIRTDVLPDENGVFNLNTPKQLLLSNTIIKNMTGTGIFSVAFNILGYNNVVANCGQYCLGIAFGGTYDFKQCTFADYYPYANRQTPLLVISNNYKLIDGTVLVASLNANFGNSIIYGSLENEIGFGQVTSGNSPFNYTFNHCLLRIDPTVSTATANYQNVIKNTSLPVFKDPTNGDYTLANGSPAIGAGDAAISNSPPYNFDIKGRSRANSGDLGAYEK